MNEFSAYGSHKAAVKNLVNKDIDAKKFFETLNSRGWSIEYHNRIEDVFEYLFVAGGSKKTNFKIFPTTIQIHDIKGNNSSTHSIVLIWSNKKLYLYDPNGVYDTSQPKWYEGVGYELQQDYGYKFNGKYFDSTKKFQKYIIKNYSKHFRVPESLGAQYILPITEGETKYIGAGGYCMFFNYMAIERIKRSGKRRFPSTYSKLTTQPFTKIFPPPATEAEALGGSAKEDTFEGQTQQIVNNVWKSGGGRRKRRRSRKKRRTSRRRRRCVTRRVKR